MSELKETNLAPEPHTKKTEKVPRNDQEKEIADTWQALQYADKIAKDRKAPLDEGFIRSLHGKVVKDFPDAKPGQYRRRAVAISGAVFTPPEWQVVPRAMQVYSEELNHRVSELDHSVDGIGKVVSLAAWAHLELVRIHPFEDGNGRTARLIADTICKRAGMYYITDWAKDIDKYLNSIIQAQATGDSGHFEEFIAESLASRYAQIENKIQKNAVMRLAAKKTQIFEQLEDRRTRLLAIAKSKNPQGTHTNQ